MHDEFCTDMDDEQIHCGQKVSEIILKTGQKYFGEINEGIWIFLHDFFLHNFTSWRTNNYTYIN